MNKTELINLVQYKRRNVLYIQYSVASFPTFLIFNLHGIPKNPVSCGRIFKIKHHLQLQHKTGHKKGISNVNDVKYVKEW